MFYGRTNVKPRFSVTNKLGLKRCHPLAFSVGYSFNERSGSKVYNVANPNLHEGSFVGDPQWVPGLNGVAISFDGAGDYITTDYDFSGKTQFTISTIFKRNKVGAGSYYYLSQYDSVNDAVQVGFYSNGICYLGVDKITSNNGYFTCNDLNWHKLSVVFDGSQVGNANRLKAYLDGVPTTLNYNGTIEAIVPNITNKFHIGERQGALRATATVENVIIHDFALPSSQVSKLAREPYCMFEKEDDIYAIGMPFTPAPTTLPPTTIMPTTPPPFMLRRGISNLGFSHREIWR